MPDVREWENGAATVRVYGLDAKGAALAGAQFELESLLADGVVAANVSLATWRGRHAEVFVEEAGRVLRRLFGVTQAVADAKRTVMSWPARPGRPPSDEENAAAPRLSVPDGVAGVSSAEPVRLDGFRSWCEQVGERVPALAGAVNLVGVAATRTGPVSWWERAFDPRRFLPELDVGSRAVDDPVPAEAGDDLGPVGWETTPVDPGRYVELPDVAGRVAGLVGSAADLGAWVGGVALAFREADERLLALIDAHPDLADELFAGFDAGGRMSGASALVVVLAWFDEFDRDRDGKIAWGDVVAMTSATQVPAYVRRAARYLEANPAVFALAETVDDRMDHSRDVVGEGGDRRLSAADVATFLAFNDRLAVVEQHFAEIDTAAHPDRDADGRISVNDLRAAADGEGTVADAAAWLLAHTPALQRLGWYQEAKNGRLGALTGNPIITRDSVVLLAVDQQVFVNDPDEAAAFVDRHFDALMGTDIGGIAYQDGMHALFTDALTTSGRRADLMERVVTEVARDGAIHNPGLPAAFAEGAAANMDVLDRRVNALREFPSRDLAVSEDLRQAYDDTAVFLREVSRDPDAAGRLRAAVFEYGMTEIGQAPESGLDRVARLSDLGRLQGVLDGAQHAALKDAAREDIRAALEAGEPVPGTSVGGITDYAISHVPWAGQLADVADALGASPGTGVDWLLSLMSDEGDHGSPDVFEALDEAEQLDRLRRAESKLNAAVWVVSDLWNADTPNGAAVREAARGQPFVDRDGQLRTDLSREEAQSFREWALTLVVLRQPAFDDFMAVRHGDDEAVLPTREIAVEDLG
ncbi:MAG TPA: hypothetical protein VIL36_11270 [Acidimicrobiales bacterium]